MPSTRTPPAPNLCPHFDCVLSRSCHNFVKASGFMPDLIQAPDAGLEYYPNDTDKLWHCPPTRAPTLTAGLAAAAAAAFLSAPLRLPDVEAGAEAGMTGPIMAARAAGVTGSSYLVSTCHPKRVRKVLISDR
jgi:hypothetical protein